MQRSSFLKICLATGTLISGPFTLLAKSIQQLRTGKGLWVKAGEDRFNEPVHLFEGDTFYTKVSSADTNGDLYIFESTRDKKGGPPLHYHFKQDEWWYILEGEFLFKVGDQTFTAKKGDSVFGPRMVPHAFSKMNEGPARMIIGFQPAGRMEAHFKAVSTGLYGKLNEEQKDKFRQANGFKVVGPALTIDKSVLH